MTAPGNGLTVIARLVARPGERAALVTACGPALAAARDEDGTLEYVLHLDTGNEDAVWFYERYRDRAAFDEHMGSEAMKEFGRSLKGVLAAPPELNVLAAVESA